MTPRTPFYYPVKEVLQCRKFFWVGKGGYALTHRGNSRVRAEIEKKGSLYLSASRSHRGRVARSLLQNELRDTKFVISRDTVLAYIEEDDKKAAEGVKGPRRIGLSRRMALVQRHGSLQQIRSYPSGVCIEVGQNWALDIIGHQLRESAALVKSRSEDSLDEEGTYCCKREPQYGLQLQEQYETRLVDSMQRLEHHQPMPHGGGTLPDLEHHQQYDTRLNNMMQQLEHHQPTPHGSGTLPDLERHEQYDTRLVNSMQRLEHPQPTMHGGGTLHDLEHHEQYDMRLENTMQRLEHHQPTPHGGETAHDLEQSRVFDHVRKIPGMATLKESGDLEPLPIGLYPSESVEGPTCPEKSKCVEEYEVLLDAGADFQLFEL